MLPPKRLGRPIGARDSKPRLKKALTTKYETGLSVHTNIETARTSSDAAKSAEDGVAASLSETAAEIAESAFDAEGAYSVQDDPFHHDWPFWRS
jgi:S-formylglutathione hydrolase FrmB